MKCLHVVIGCDVDPDRQPQGRTCGNQELGDYWQGITVGIPALLRACSARRIQVPPITWLLRADLQIFEHFGKFDFLFNCYAELWDQLIAAGHEIGWHPHLYKWDSRSKKWVPDLRDLIAEDWLYDAIVAISASAQIKSTRTGWDFQSNALMNFFDKAGILVDFSALPEFWTETLFDRSHVWTNDWSITPHKPYFPSGEDYRRPARNQEKILRILELPVTMSLRPFHWRLAKFLHQRFLRARFPDLKISSLPFSDTKWWVRTFTASPQNLKSAFSTKFREAMHSKEEVFYVTYFHANELLSKNGIQNFVSNLEMLFGLQQKYGVQLDFIRASDASKMLVHSLRIPLVRSLIKDSYNDDLALGYPR